MNWICECFLYRLFILMASVNVSSLLFVYVNGICELFLDSLFVWMESVNVSFIIHLYKWNMLMLSVSCFADIVQVALVKILLSSFAFLKYKTSTWFCHYYIFAYKLFSFSLYYSYSNLVCAAVIGFIFNSMCRFRKKTDI